MVELTLNEIKLREVQLLKEIKNICEKHNLRYFLTAGTLIGAIRHKGFIPWDDDIDIVMPRKDYDSFLKIYKNEYNNNNLYSFEMDKKYGYMYAKLCDKDTILYHNQDECIKELGALVDIFPMDGMGNTKKEAIKHFKKIRPYLVLNNLYRKKPYYKAIKWYKAPLKYFIHKFSRILNIKSIRTRINNSSWTYDFETSEFVGNLAHRYELKNIFPHWVYDKALKVDFEGEKFNIPVGYDYILKQVYGDYMTPPPPEKQVAPHGYKVYRLN